MNKRNRKPGRRRTKRPRLASWARDWLLIVTVLAAVILVWVFIMPVCREAEAAEMAYYFRYGDDDPFAGKTESERLALWGADEFARKRSAELQAERETDSWPK